MNRFLRGAAGTMVGAILSVLPSNLPGAAPGFAQTHGQPTSASQAGQVPHSQLQDLQSIAQFREAFNHDAGKIRLVLLLSPT